MRNRSLCRWHYDVEPYDATRVPACIHKVVSCVNKVHHDTENQCEMVTVLLTVRRQSGSSWVDEQIQLPVACTLARPREHRVQYRTAATLPYTLH